MATRRSLLAAAGLVAIGGPAAACAKKEPAGGGGTKTITLGFSQTGSESGWRTANTKSINEAAAAAGINLKFLDAQGKEENQIDAKIPVILTDRSVDVADTSLYVCFIGSDFIDEGKRAAAMMKKIMADAPGPVNIAQLEGSTGSAPAIERTKGFAEAIAGDAKYKIVVTQTGDFTRAKGKEVMEAFLKAHPEINFLFAQNDDMGLGAIQAIEAAGKKPGTDIKIVAIDAIKDGFQAMADKKINGLVECNPLLGPQLMELVKKVAAGQTVERRIVTVEKDFTQDQAAAELPNRKY
jgi:galactofuranose transport system substrate-binding protein